MTEPHNRFSKEYMRQFQPGNRKKQSNKATGDAAEKDVAAHFQTTSKKKIKRNPQNGKPWGGASNPDVEAMEGWAIEVKDTDRLELPKWIGKLLSETPKNKKPGLVFTIEKEKWLTVRLADRVNLGVDSVEQAGGEVYFP